MKIFRYILVCIYASVMLLFNVQPKATVTVCILDSGSTIGTTIQYDENIDCTDYGGHGTFCAGQIREFCPDAEILSYCITPVVDGQTVYDVQYINLALKDVLGRAESGYIVLLNVYGDGFVEETHDLIMALIDKGVPVIVPSGNEGKDPQGIGFPSCMDEVICVGAVDAQGEYQFFSNFHEQVDFCDIGRDVQGVQLDGTIGAWHGTCIAAARLTGKCAAILYGKPNMTEHDLVDYLKTIAVDLNEAGRDQYTGWGMIP